MSDTLPGPFDDELSRRLAQELPRHAAPARLRVAIIRAAEPAPRRWGRGWFGPSLAAAATTLVLVLAFLPMLPRLAPADPVQRLVRSVVAEHTRVRMWGARRPDVVPAALPWVTEESGVGLERVFIGDDRLEALGAEPVFLEQRRGLAIHYRDTTGRLVSYVAIPAPEMPIPERRRVEVDRFRPALFHDHGHSVWVWKQGDLVCLLVGSLVTQAELQDFRDYFVRVRSETEPFLPY